METEHIDSQPRQKFVVLKASANYGAIYGLVLIANNLIIYLFEIKPTNPVVQILGILIMMGGLILGTWHFRKNTEEPKVSYGRAYSISFLTVLFGTIIFAVYYFIFLKFIDPTVIDQMLTVQENAIMNRYPDMSQAQIDKILEQQRKFMTPAAMAIWTVVGVAFWTAVLSLITSIFLRKRDKSNILQ
ncbi:MAG: DUF4199 domain-containing protein [Bacteroidetes bacterium]|nr:DUF4199 domain-containing protein [Bacteroidota bacterium]MBU1717737.1 DUF4199 domain-containing protein [Bacteroidota bacterium]